MSGQLLKFPNERIQREIRIKPCPFGHRLEKGLQGVQQMVGRDADEPGPYNVECIDCGASGPWGVTLEDAAEKWNVR